MHTDGRYEVERLALQRLLSSEYFDRAPGLARLLQYVCEKYFAGEEEQVKEYNIAIEALGRGPDFDQKKDSIVRVEAHRLRKRLHEYYTSAGAEDPVQITIPEGRYIPRFVYRDTAQLQLVKDTAVHVPVGEIRRTKDRVRVGAVSLLLIALALMAWQYFPGQPSAEARVGVSPNPDGAIPDLDAVRILAGHTQGNYTDRFGKVWLSDRYVQGGEAQPTPSRNIRWAYDQMLYKHQRTGEFSYSIPLKPGAYELRLMFAETMYGEGNTLGGGESTRLFRIEINGKRLDNELDVIADAGGSNTATVKVFRDVRPSEDGHLHLRFKPSRAFLNAIEIVPSSAGRVRPLRFTARSHVYQDVHGNLWEPDWPASSGVLMLRPNATEGSFDSELYRGERYGNFEYTIPVAPGRYKVTLHFSEHWFGPGMPGGGGAGSRIFDVHCNHRPLLTNFDVIKEAGGPLRALKKTFHGVEPNPQGKLIFTFRPSRNYALINAIEIVDE